MAAGSHSGMAKASVLASLVALVAGLVGPALSGTAAAASATPARPASSARPAGGTNGSERAAGHLVRPRALTQRPKVDRALDVTCDVAQPELGMIIFTLIDDSQQEICGMWSVEDDAYTMYAEMHGYPAGDPRIAETGAPEIGGFIESMLESIATIEASDPSSLTADEIGAYDWMYSVDDTFQLTAAQDAVNEYNKWNSEQCNYQPPNTHIFTYDTSDQPACDGGEGASLGGLFAGVNPPSYQEFIAYGVYDADQTLDVTNALGGDNDQQVVEDGITAGIGTGAAIMAGAAPQILSALQVGTTGLADFLKLVQPYAARSIQRAAGRLVARDTTLQNAKDTQTEDELDAEGDSDPDLVELEDGPGLDVGDGADLDTIGLDTTEMADAGADALTGPFAIVALAATIAATEGITVVTGSEIPGQLQTNLSNVKGQAESQVVNSLLTDPTSAGYDLQVQNFEDELTLPDIVYGNTTIESSPPAAAAGTADEIQVTALQPNGTPSNWTWTAPTVDHIDTWPLGVNDGLEGPPEETIGVQDGVAWTEQDAGYAPTDETAAGLSGYLPSGEIRYFNSAGKPETAFIDGTDFATLTSTGSIDAGGQDQGDYCASLGECTLSSSIVVMGLGGTAQLVDHLEGTQFLGQTCGENDPGVDDCLSDNLLPDGDLVPSGGTTTLTQTSSVHQDGTSQLFRLTLVQDPGTAPAIQITNSQNALATDQPGIPGEGGDAVGQTVTLADWETDPWGYATTYTWQIESKCAYDPTNPPVDVQGVPVCSSNTDDYHSINGLGSNEQDLTTCIETVFSCNPGDSSDWAEDPAFHGDPVTTLTGQSVSWTWPAPGTYDVRLITKDAQGTTHQADEEVAVTGPGTPTASFSFSSTSGTQPSATYSVVSPVKDGDQITVTGCLHSEDFSGSTAYSTPSVDIDWGDGSSDLTGTAGSTNPSGLTFTYDPGGSCTSPWQFSATHTYDVDVPGTIPFIQKQMAITIGDQTIPATTPDLIPPNAGPNSYTYDLYANIYPLSDAPTFVNGAQDSVSVTAGDPVDFTGYTTGVDSNGADSISDSPATGVTDGGSTCTAGLPAGVGIDAYQNNSFLVTGTVNVSDYGCYAIDITATNSYGSARQVFVLEENAAPIITSADSDGMEVGGTGSFTFTATGYPAPTLSLESSDLPSDLDLESNGGGSATLSSGSTDLAATDSGTYSFTVKAVSSAGTTTQPFTLTIGGDPVFTSGPTAGFMTGSPGSFEVTTAGYPTTTSITCTYEGGNCDTGGLGFDYGGPGDEDYGIFWENPDGSTPTDDKTVDASSAQLSGVPASANSYTVTLTATNAVGSTSQTVTIYASNTGGPELTMAQGSASPNLTEYTAPGTYGPDQPADGTAVFPIGSPGTVTLCSADPDDTLSLSAALPAGLTLTNDSGGSDCGSGEEATISGTPSDSLTAGSTGDYNEEITDGGGGLEALDIRLESSSGPILSSPDTATFTVGQAGSFTVSQGTDYDANGEPGQYADWEPGCLSESGPLPDGLTFLDNGNNTATLSGTPTAGGSTTVSIDATYCGSGSTSQTLTIDVQSPPSFTSAARAGFDLGAGGSFTVTTAAAEFPVPSLSVSGQLPPGVTFTDNGDGTGTITVAADAPATAAPASFTLDAESAAGTATQPFGLVIGTEPAFSTSSPSEALFTSGSPSSFTFATAATPDATVTCAVSGVACGAGNLPAGITFTDNGDGTAILAGTPSGPGTVDLTLSADNGVGSPATLSVDVDVDTTPSFTGTTTTSGCTSPSAATSETFQAGTTGTWTLCASGSPTPAMLLESVECNGAVTGLPSGLTFTDNGDGSATISGDPANGSGSACPTGYELVLGMSNGAGTVTQDLTLPVLDEIVATSAPDDPTFVAGAPSSYTLTASGIPAPGFTVDPSTPLPGWLSFSDNGNGTATLSGTPPLGSVGASVDLTVDESDQDAATVADPVAISIAPFGLTAASPPAADLGQPYSYTFNTSEPVTFTVAAGTSLPAGLALSPSGTLSGTPTEMGRFPVALTLSADGTTVTTATIDVLVQAGSHSLEISQFRTFGPLGLSDWFVQVYNATTADVPLTGWDIGLVPVGASCSPSPCTVPATMVSLGTGTLAPGATAVVAGPSYGLESSMPAAAIGPDEAGLPGGFEIVAPDGEVTDVAGQAGAPSGFVAGTGAALPSALSGSVEDSFVRAGYSLSSTGPLTDTGDNASDFTYGSVVAPATASYPVSVASGPPVAPPPAGSPSSGSTELDSTSYSSSQGATLTGQSGDASATVSVPPGALPEGTSISLYSVSTSDLPAPPESGSTYVVAFAVSWKAPDGSSPTLADGQQVTLTIDDPGIVPGDVVYALGPNGTLTQVGVASQAGTYTLTFGSDPVFVIAAPPGKTVPTPPPAAQGYRLVGADGGIFDFGSASYHGSASGRKLSAPVSAAADDPQGGYWLAGADGAVYAFGSGRSYGSALDNRLGAPVVAMASTPDGRGYWLAASNGAVAAFGDAPYFGSESGTRLAAPIVGMAAAPDGDGYWLVARDGGVFSFGSAGFHGSTGALRLAAPMVGIAATPDGDGYWLVAADGGVFSFGSAGFHGSTGAIRLAQPVVGIIASTDGGGYWLVARDGGVFSFGDAAFRGSAGALHLSAPVVAGMGA